MNNNDDNNENSSLSSNNSMYSATNNNNSSLLVSNHNGLLSERGLVLLRLQEVQQGVGHVLLVGPGATAINT